MSRLPHLTPLMRPTSLQPSLRGPRDAAPPCVHSIATAEERAADTPAAAPTPTEPKGKTMPSPTQETIVSALKKKCPQTREQLMAATKLTSSQFDMAIMLMSRNGRIEKSGGLRSRLYGLPGTQFPTVAPAKAGAQPKPAKRAPKAERESFADGVKAREREQALIDARYNLNDPAHNEHSNGTDLHPARLAAPMATASPFDSCADRIFDATAIPCRAIATANGGAIVLRGHQLTAELSAEELNVLHQLRG